jgi:hypothetical protein
VESIEGAARVVMKTCYPDCAGACVEICEATSARFRQQGVEQGFTERISDPEILRGMVAIVKTVAKRIRHAGEAPPAS